MGTWSATIGGNDYFLDIEKYAIETCGINLFDYLEDNSLFTSHLFNKYFNNICDFALKREKHQGPLALGALILKNGSFFPQDIKQKVLNEIEIELDNYIYDDPEYKKVRHSYLREFKEQVENYIEGVREDVKEESLIGINFKREFLQPVIKDLKQFKAPQKVQEFVEFLLADLKMPLNTILEEINVQSIEEFLLLLQELDVIGEEIRKTNKDDNSQGFEIVLFAQLLREHITQTRSIESFWLGYTNVNELRKQPELREGSGHYYLVYRLALYGKNYIGQCFGSINKRAAQHIAQFRIAPVFTSVINL
ncbi:MAG: hypothetical protein ACFE91_11920 [Promethearchaeota archaeon]